MKNIRKDLFQIPVTDYSFKQIFALDRNKRYLISFLNCFLSQYVGEITDVDYLPTEKYGSDYLQKKMVFDIFCTDTLNRNFIIEMQRAKQYEYVDRSIVYLSRAMSESAQRGMRTYHLIPTYSVNILDFELPQLKNDGDCFKAYFYKDQKNRLLTDKVGVFYMNLCNFAAKQSGVTDTMRKWLYLLKNMQNMDETDYEQQSGIFRDLMDECRISKLSVMEKEHYEKSVLEYEDVQEAIRYAREEAAEVAFEKGVEEGREEGVSQLVKTMSVNGMDKDLIAKMTGLSKTEVESIVG